MKTQKLCMSLVVVAVALTGGFLGCDNTPVTSEDYIARGEESWKDKDYDEAVDDFNIAIKLNPESKSNRGAYYNLRADYWKSQDNPQRYIEDINRYYVMSKRIDFIPADNLDAALKRYDGQIAKFPNDCGAHIMRGKILLKLNKPEKSLSDMYKAVSLDPEFSYAISYHAWHQESQEKWQEASNNYGKALALNPNNWMAKAGKKRIHDHVRPRGLKKENYMFHDKRTGTFHDAEQ